MCNLAPVDNRVKQSVMTLYEFNLKRIGVRGLTELVEEVYMTVPFHGSV